MNRATSVSSSASLLLALLLLPACGVRDRIEQRINEEIAEKIVEVAAGGELDVEVEDGKVSVVGKDGSTLEVDEAGKVISEDGKGGRATMDREVPKDFPIALPELTNVITTQRVESADKAISITVTAEAKSKDLQTLAKDVAADLERKGMIVERNEVATGEGAMVMLAGKNEAAKLEANCVLSLGSDPEHPGVTMMLSWVDRSAVAPE
jgi:hypothetical protein